MLDDVECKRAQWDRDLISTELGIGHGEDILFAGEENWEHENCMCLRRESIPRIVKVSHPPCFNQSFAAASWLSYQRTSDQWHRQKETS